MSASCVLGCRPLSMIQQTRVHDNLPGGRFILPLAALSAALYLVLALSGDLREQLPLYLAVCGLLSLMMWAAVRLCRGRPRTLFYLLLIAALFRLISAAAPPTLSDDIYRYVWDGRVQAAGHHPYSYAPTDARLAPLRDENWERINHPEVKTIYPPLAQMLFGLLGWMGFGPFGFKLVMALADMAVVAALVQLLKRLQLPPERVLWYAWNPLAVLESAGSGHLEPIGVALLVLGTTALAAGWGRRGALWFAAAIQIKLLPLALLLTPLRRRRWKTTLLFVVVLVALTLPYALYGPALGSGLSDYAERWERNATLYRAVEGSLELWDSGERLKRWVAAAQRTLPLDDSIWNWLYSHVWPRELARLFIALFAGCWLLWLSIRSRRTPAREIFLALAGLLLLMPTLHPWYLLWILPFVALYASPGWLLLAALIPLSYIDVDGDVPWWARVVEFGLPLLLTLALIVRSRRARRATMGA